jgi:hypothetical protein
LLPIRKPPPKLPLFALTMVIVNCRRAASAMYTAPPLNCTATLLASIHDTACVLLLPPVHSAPPEVDTTTSRPRKVGGNVAVHYLHCKQQNARHGTAQHSSMASQGRDVQHFTNTSQVVHSTQWCVHKDIAVLHMCSKCPRICC